MAVRLVQTNFGMLCAVAVQPYAVLDLYAHAGQLHCAFQLHDAVLLVTALLRCITGSTCLWMRQYNGVQATRQVAAVLAIRNLIVDGWFRALLVLR